MATEAECLDALRTAARELDESPTKAEYEELGPTPAASTILRVCGGWNEAKERTGLETYDAGQFGGTGVEPKPDHVDLTDKEFSVSRCANRGYSKENIRAEMERCVVLCANCHRKEHYEPPPRRESDSV